MYYSAHELDVYPTSRTSLFIEYPARAALERVSGRVLVRVSLDETGKVSDVSIVSAEPQGYFEDAVRAALAGARFRPGRKDGRDVRSRILIKLEFDPGATQKTPR